MIRFLQKRARNYATKNNLLAQYQGPEEPLTVGRNISSRSVNDAIARGFVLPGRNGLRPGLLLNLAAAQYPANDLSSFLPSALRRPLFDSLLISECIQIKSSREIPLRHADYHTSHYFDGDRLFANATAAREFITKFFGFIVHLLNPGFLACSLSTIPDSLVGTYPLCYHLALQESLDLITMISRRKERRFLINPPRSVKPGIIVHDVLTTGISIDTLNQELSKERLRTLGCIVIFNRDEGGDAYLQEKGIRTASLIGLPSLRLHCQQICDSKRGSAFLRCRAAQYLKATHRFQIIEQTFRHAPRSHATFGVAPGFCPPLDAWDQRGNVLPQHRPELRRQVQAAVDEAVSRGLSLLVFPELTVTGDCIPLFEAASRNNPLVIVAGMEYDNERRNIAAVAINGKVFQQAKIVRSPYDFPGMTLGDQIYVFKETILGRFAVLVCADQVNFQILNALKGQIELLIVVSRNPSRATFQAISTGDAYRVYSYILVANDKNFGPSWLSSPLRGPSKTARLKRLSNSRNLVGGKLSIGELRHLGKKFLRQLAFNPLTPEERRGPRVER